MELYIRTLFIAAFFLSPLAGHAQELINEEQGVLKAEVVEVVEETSTPIEGTDAESVQQTLRAEIIEGDRKGEIITFENDFITLDEGDVFFLNYLNTFEGDTLYSVRDVDRRTALYFFIALFVAAIIAFGGKQGVRSLLSLAGSFAVILFVLLPLLLKGYPPILTSIFVAAFVLLIAIFVTHGLNKESVAAFLGTASAVVLTGILAYIGVHAAKLTGFTTDEAVYLNFGTAGTLDFAGLLLGSIMIGVLGVLDDIAVTQAAVVSELYHTDRTLSRRDVYKRAVRVGREHVGALVNTLALAYAGASLPLLLLFSTSESPFSTILNTEVFATEIIRTVVGSIGLILTVPITTFIAARMLKDYERKHSHSHSHSHGHHH